MAKRPCTKCGVLKSITEFAKDKNFKDGYTAQCLACRREHLKIYRINNREKILQSRKYRQENKGILNEKSRIYKKKRRATDIAYNILIRLRSRLYKAIRGMDKSATTKILLGCSPQKLIEYLELKFTDGMSWDRFGEIHIDHIIPCASFDLTDPDQQKQCFHYTNLQPLWAEDNRKKGDRYGTS